jgi:hypothetical protein
MFQRQDLAGLKWLTDEHGVWGSEGANTAGICHFSDWPYSRRKVPGLTPFGGFLKVMSLSPIFW